jgi:hypothetical protein
MRQAFRIVLGGVVTMGALLLPGVAHAAPPPNDNFAARETIAVLPFSDTVVTTEATTEAGEPDPAEPPQGCGSSVSKTVWYQFSPSSSTVVDADTFGSDFDTVLAVWTGSSLSTLSPVDCNDDTGPDFDSQVLFRAFRSTTYLIQIGGYQGESGNLELHLKSVDIKFFKSVDLTAKPKRVEEGQKTRLRAEVSPCRGHEGQNVVFFRGSKKIATKKTNDNCVAVLRPKIKKTSKFHAESPVQDDDHVAGVSDTVRVTLKG